MEIDFSSATFYDAPLKMMNLNEIIRRNNFALGADLEGGAGLNGLTLHNGNKITFVRARNNKSLYSGLYTAALPLTNRQRGLFPISVLGGVSGLNTTIESVPTYDVVANVETQSVEDYFKNRKTTDIVRAGYVYNKTNRGLRSYTNANDLMRSAEATDELAGWRVITSWAYYNRASGANFPRVNLGVLSAAVIFDCAGYYVPNINDKYNPQYISEKCNIVVPIKPANLGANDDYDYLSGFILGNVYNFALIGQALATPFTDSCFKPELINTSGIRIIGGNVAPAPVGSDYEIAPYMPIVNNNAAAEPEVVPVYQWTGAGGISSLTQPIIAFKDNSAIKKFYADFGLTVTIDNVAAAMNTPREDIPFVVGDDEFVPTPSETPTFGFSGSVVTSMPSYPDNTSDIVPITPPFITPSVATTSYVLDVTDVKNLLNFLMTSDYTKNASELFNDKLSPLVGMNIFPFDIALHDAAHISPLLKINLAGVETPVEASTITAGYNVVVNGGSITTTGYYGDFNDYVNTSYFIYIPYVGTVSIDSSDVVNRTLELKYVIDLTTGSGTAILYSNGVLIKSFACNVATQIPITYTNANEVAISENLKALSVISGVVSTVAGTGANLAAGNIGGAAASLIQGGLGIGSQLMSHEQLQVGAIGTIGASTSQLMPQTAFLTIVRKRIAQPDDYGVDCGKPTAYRGKISDFAGHGFVSVIAENLGGFDATEQEKSMIQKCLADGIFV